MHIMAKCPKNSKMELQFQMTKWFLSYGSNNQNLVLIINSGNACIAYLNVNAILEFIWVPKIHKSFFKKGDNFWDIVQNIIISS